MTMSTPGDLADPDEPFVDAMQASSSYKPVPNYRQTQEHIANIRKTLAELPLPTKQMNTLSVVLTYSMIGISDAEIGTAIGISPQIVRQMQQSDAFVRMRDDIVNSILAADSDDVRSIIASHAKGAATRVASLVDDADPNVALSASKDILDRSGHRAADRLIIEGMDELRIRIISDEEVPTIDITPTRED